MLDEAPRNQYEGWISRPIVTLYVAFKARRTAVVVSSVYIGCIVPTGYHRLPILWRHQSCEEQIHRSVQILEQNWQRPWGVGHLPSVF